jgi:hypothetical protein
MQTALRRRPSAQGCLDSLAKALDPERPLQAAGDPSVAVDREEPGLRLQVVGPQRSAKTLIDLVLAGDLLVD